MRLADILAYSIVIGGILGFIYIVWRYLRGLKNTPRDLWFLFCSKLIEYSAYTAMNLSFVLWLSKDCGLGDLAAGAYISAWATGLCLVSILTGALVDFVGIRKLMIVSMFLLLISRCFMAWLTNPIIIMAVGFIPLAIGFAIIGPIVSVAIKRYTTKEAATLGFGLFYVIINIGTAIGSWLFDFLRNTFVARDTVGKIIDENIGTTLPVVNMHFSTYQLTFLIGICATLVSAIFIFKLRDGVEIDDDGIIKITPPQKKEGTFFIVLQNSVVNTSKETYKMLRSAISEKFFWYFIGMLTSVMFVRTIFFHLYYTFPTYGVRVLGEGAKTGTLNGVLNCVLVIYLTPLVALLTTRVSSYTMLLVGSLISSLSVLIAAIPGSVFDSLTNGVFGELVFIKWLGLADNMAGLAANPPSEAYWPLIFFIIVFSFGEAIWAPRLVQYTAEIAPKGKEGTYLALSILPWFASKIFVGPMSGWLIGKYTPLIDKLDGAGKVIMDANNNTVQITGDLSNHYMIWVWIGGVALITPITLSLYRNFFNKKVKESKLYVNT